MLNVDLRYEYISFSPDKLIGDSLDFKFVLTPALGWVKYKTKCKDSID